MVKNFLSKILARDLNGLNIISVCKFEFIENVVAKNVDQKDSKLKLKLMGIDLMKIDKQYEINLLFSDNRFITLYSEIIEVTLEDLKKK